MPVTATPVAVANPSGEAICADQKVSRADATTLYGCAVNARKRSVQAVQGQNPTVAWNLLDPKGRQVDLSGCGAFNGSDSSEVRVRVRETIEYTATPVTIAATVTDAFTGALTFELPSTITTYPGVYLCEAAVYNADAALVFTNQFYLVVNRGLFGAVSQNGPPTLAEIRLHIRDSDAQENELLENVQFDMAEIAAAIERPVLYWNESQPPIDCNHTTKTFPHRFHWMEGLVAQLYITAAHWYRRNSLPYSAGGLQVDDLNKAKEYEEIGRLKWEEYKRWVLQKKVQINCEAAIQSSYMSM